MVVLLRYANEINARTSVSKLSEVLGLVAGATPSLCFSVTCCSLLQFAPSCALAKESVHSPFDLLEELLEAIAKTLVNHPEKVQVRAKGGVDDCGRDGGGR